MKKLKKFSIELNIHDKRQTGGKISYYHDPLLLLICILLFFPACTHQPGSVLQVQKILAMNQDLTRRPYLIGPGDELAVRFYYNTSLNDEVMVRPDGKISLQLIDEEQAAGLTTSQLDALLTQAYAHALKTSSDTYALAVGDQLHIRSYYHEKINLTVVVRPDGKIALPLLDEIDAAGISPGRLDILLTKKYAKLLTSPELTINVLSFHQPDLSVTVKSSAGQKVYVGGEVQRPGVMPISGTPDILDAVIHAAGPLSSGDLSRVILIRRGAEGSPEVHIVNAEKSLSIRTPGVRLAPYDIVYVPKTRIADLTHYLRSYLWELLPRQVAFSFLYNWNNEVQIEK